MDASSVANAGFLLRERLAEISESIRLRMDPSETDKSQAIRSAAAWAAVYFFAMLAIVIFLRVLVLVATGGRGIVASAVIWLSEPFVYPLNRGIGLPNLMVGRGRIELGSIAMLGVYAAVGVGTWLLVAGWDSYSRRLAEFVSALRKDDSQ